MDTTVAAPGAPTASADLASGERTADGVVTLDDVARAAGVSTATVSRVLNGTARVRADKVAAVQAAVTQLKFRLNPLAQGLARGRTQTLGVVIQFVESPFYGEVMRGVDERLAGSGFVPLFVSGHWDARVEGDCLRSLLARRVDGVVLLHARLDDDALQALVGDVPLVVAGRDSLQGPRCWSFCGSDAEGARTATRHLLQLGHRQIAFLGGPPDHADTVERQRGYQLALREAGIEPDPLMQLDGQLHAQGGLLSTIRLLDSARPFTALFAANDEMAYGARLALQRRGLRVPEDVSLVGFDDLRLSAFMTPPLTTVRQSASDIGRQAVEGLLTLLAGGRPTAPPPPATLVVRESTQPFRR